MKIARVFPRITKMTAVDQDTYGPDLDLFTRDRFIKNKYDEVHISVTFSWDLAEATSLFKTLNDYYPNKVKVGGQATNDPGAEFIPGRYLKEGITITSRGCPNHCPWCFVPKREGKIRELPIKTGHIIQDNNLLACSKTHINKVFDMLEGQKHIDFSGGLEPRRINNDIINRLKNLSIHHLWLAADKPQSVIPTANVIAKLRKYFNMNQVRCYVLVGFEGDTLKDAEDRLSFIYKVGGLPFAMRYRNSNTDFKKTFVYPEREWNLLARNWTRPAIMKARGKAALI